MLSHLAPRLHPTIPNQRHYVMLQLDGNWMFLQLVPPHSCGGHGAQRGALSVFAFKVVLDALSAFIVKDMDVSFDDQDVTTIL